MPTERIQLNTGSNKDTEEVGLSTGNTAYLDVVIDDQGVSRRRPGLYLLGSVGNRPIDGLAYWPGQDVVIVSTNAKIYLLYRDGTLIDVTGTGIPTAGQPISFTEYTTTQAYIASSGRIISLPAGDVTSFIADSDAPVLVDTIAAIDTYLLANKSGTGEFHWSDVADPTSWLGEFATAEGRPDNILAIHENNKLLYAFGTSTIQTFRDDGVTPWVTEYQGYVSRGIASKSAVVLCPYDTRFYFLDNTRTICRLDGLTVTPVSSSINRYIAKFAAVDDVRASYMQVEGRPYLLWYFPSEQKTLVLDVRNQDGYWYEWNRWNPLDNEYSPFLGGASTIYIDQWGLTLVGDRITGNIYYLTNDYYQDNAKAIRSAIRTARINRKSESRRKFCKSLTLRVKKHRSITSEPVMFLRYRNDGREEWTGERTIPLHAVGGEYRATCYALGSYYSRQWEFACSDDCAWELATVDEDYDMERA